MRETITSSLIALLAGTAGERMSLWLEGVKLTRTDQLPRVSRKRPQTASDDEAEQERGQDRKRREVISLAGRGLLGTAVWARPGHSSNGRNDHEIKGRGAWWRQPQNEVTELALLVPIRFFCCRGLRGTEWPEARLLQTVGGEEGQAQGLSNLLAARKASAELRTFIGGVRGTALFKRAKDGSDDAHPHALERRSAAQLVEPCWRRR